MVSVISCDHAKRRLDFSADDAARHLACEGFIASPLILRHAQGNVLGFQSDQAAFEPPVPGEEGRVDSMAQKGRDGSRCQMHVAEDDNALELQKRDIGHARAIAIDDQALALLSHHGTLFEQIERTHAAPLSAGLRPRGEAPLAH
jgi:hypothetical protein